MRESCSLGFVSLRGAIACYCSVRHRRRIRYVLWARVRIRFGELADNGREPALVLPQSSPAYLGREVLGRFSNRLAALVCVVLLTFQRLNHDASAFVDIGFASNAAKGDIGEAFFGA